MGNPLFLWPFSIAMLVYQRVYNPQVMAIEWGKWGESIGFLGTLSHPVNGPDWANVWGIYTINRKQIMYNSVRCDGWHAQITEVHLYYRRHFGLENRHGLCRCQDGKVMEQYGKVMEQYGKKMGKSGKHGKVMGKIWEHMGHDPFSSMIYLWTGWFSTQAQVWRYNEILWRYNEVLKDLKGYW